MIISLRCKGKNWRTSGAGQLTSGAGQQHRRLGQLSEFEQDSNTNSEQESNTDSHSERNQARVARQSAAERGEEAPPSTCVTTETKPLDRLGQLGEFEQDKHVCYNRDKASRPAWPAR